MKNTVNAKRDELGMHLFSSRKKGSGSTARQSPQNDSSPHLMRILQSNRGHMIEHMTENLTRAIYVTGTCTGQMTGTWVTGVIRKGVNGMTGTKVRT